MSKQLAPIEGVFERLHDFTTAALLFTDAAGVITEPCRQAWALAKILTIRSLKFDRRFERQV